MNSYKMVSDSYREYLETHPDISAEKKAEIERKIKILDYLEGCSKEDRFELFDSGAFQEIAKGYYLIAIENSQVSEETKSILRRELRTLFDTVTASEAEEYYFHSHSV